jgi:hypothetical protein
MFSMAISTVTTSSLQESQKNQLSNCGGRKENSNPKKKSSKFVDTSFWKSSCEGFGAGGKWRKNSFGRDLQANDLNEK